MFQRAVSKMTEFRERRHTVSFDVLAVAGFLVVVVLAVGLYTFGRLRATYQIATDVAEVRALIDEHERVSLTQNEEVRRTLNEMAATLYGVPGVPEGSTGVTAAVKTIADAAARRQSVAEQILSTQITEVRRRLTELERWRIRNPLR